MTAIKCKIRKKNNQVCVMENTMSETIPILIYYNFKINLNTCLSL